ncbi:hypothetical protein K1T71_015307 [Dendrolimus kikuchii]|nr:hypothetical protein K1T71_015307 [Dendrolimus kikuchii]
MEAECPKVETWYVCKQQTIHQKHTQRDCLTNLIIEQKLTSSCHPTSINLAKEALLEFDSQHYIISLPRKTKVQTSCKQEEHRILEGSFLATIPRKCSIHTSEFIIINTDDKIRGQYNLITIDLNVLHNIQHQVPMESPTKLSTKDFSSLYHTTIPTYLLISSAVVLIMFLYFHLYSKKPAMDANNETLSEDIELPHISKIKENMQEHRATFMFHK